MAVIGTTVVDFLGHVILGDEAEGGDATISAAVERAGESALRYRWMSAAMHAAVGYVIAGLVQSPVTIRGDGREPRDYEEWLWNVRPNPNQSRAQFVARLVDRMFFSRQRYALVVPAHDSIWLADSWVRRDARGQATPRWWAPDTYEDIAVNGVANAIRGPLTADEVYVFRVPETGAWRSLMRSMEATHEEMARSAVEAFGDKNARRWVLQMDASMTGTQQQQDDINQYLLTYMGAFAEGRDVAIPMWRGMQLNREKPAHGEASSKLDVVQLREDAFRTVANCLRIPVSFLEGNVNNYETVMESMLTFAIDPIARAIEDEVCAKSVSPGGWRKGDRAHVDTTHIRHVDLFAVADKAEKLVGSMIDSPNEIREFTGQERVDKPGMDDYQMTKNHELAGGGKQQ